jgi:iron complex outermembrane receptor protein
MVSPNGKRAPARRRSPLGTSLTLAALGAVGLALLSARANAQDEPAPAEPAPAEPAPTETEKETAPAAPPAETADAAALQQELPPESSGGEVGEVVVTVDRREKNLQKYSGTASAFSGEQLGNVGIQSVRDLSAAVPGLQIGVQEGSTEVYIRGIGNDNNAEHGDSAVATYLDNVYLPRPRGIGALFFDIERVEVNSGPQGTTRGRNAMGGSLNIVTAKPKLGEFGAFAQATFGTYSERRYEGMVNIPIGDTLAFRFAALSSVHDPHWQNGGPLWDLRPAQDEDALALRAQTRWQPSEAFTVTAGYDYTQEGGTGYIGANYFEALTRTNDNGTPGDPSDDIPTPIDPDDIENPRNIFQLGMQAGIQMRHQGARLEVEYDAGPVIVSALGSYRDLEYSQRTGGSDGVIYPGYDFANQGTDFFGGSYSYSTSQSGMAELRVYAPDSARLRWTVGAFAFLEDQQVVLAQTSDPANYYGGAEFNMPDVDDDSYAAYADATFDVDERFRVLGGIRATRETKSRFDGLAMQLGSFPGNNTGGYRFGTEGYRPAYFGRDIYTLPQDSTLDERVQIFLDGIGSFGARDTVPQAVCADPPEGSPRITVSPEGKLSCTAGANPALAAEGAGNFNIGVVPQNAEVKNTFFDWRAGVEYDLAERNMLYATVGTAHKAGGYNDTIYGPAGPDGPTLFNTDYDPESLMAFELGSKNELLERHLRLNASLFYYRYKNQVFQQIVQIQPDTDPDPDNDTSSDTAVRQNAASSNLYGIDMDVFYALPFGLEAELHVLVMDARFGQGTIVNDGRLDFSLSEYQVDLDGNWLPRASPFTFNYSLSQLILTDIGAFDWQVQGQTVAKHYMSVFNGRLLPEVNDRAPGQNGQPENAAYSALLRDSTRLNDEVPTYTRFDVAAGWAHPDGRIRISGYVNNVTNLAYSTTTITTPNLNLRFFNPPRTAGIRFRVDW